MEEIWMPIRGAEDRYQISNLGRVKTIKFRFGEEWILKQKITKSNYHYVGLTNFRGVKRPSSIGVSKLVAEAFIPNPMEYTEVKHLDGDKSNNRVENLQWVEQDKNNRKASPFIYRVYHKDSPTDVKEFGCQHDAEMYLKAERGLRTKPNLNHHVYHHQGNPDSFGYCVERIRLTKSDFELKRMQK